MITKEVAVRLAYDAIKKLGSVHFWAVSDPINNRRGYQPHYRVVFILLDEEGKVLLQNPADVPVYVYIESGKIEIPYHI